MRDFIEMVFMIIGMFSTIFVLIVTTLAHFARKREEAIMMAVPGSGSKLFINGHKLQYLEVMDEEFVIRTNNVLLDFLEIHDERRDYMDFSLDENISSLLEIVGFISEKNDNYYRLMLSEIIQDWSDPKQFTIKNMNSAFSVILWHKVSAYIENNRYHVKG